jgi:hypothetical protein
MLSHTLEFLRIADTQPGDEKVRRRRESATELVTSVGHKDQHKMLLALVQGAVAGFQSPVFGQQSPVVSLLIKAIQDKDATLPNDLTENAVEIRAIAGIVVGEMLTNHAKTPEAVLAALSVRSALSSCPGATEKYLRWMLDTLLAAADKVIASEARLRRQRGTPALAKLGELEEPAEDVNAWPTFLPAVQAAIREAHEQEKINREEIETLWWMFAGHSDVEEKALADISSPVAAAFCCGLELAKRAILPPASSSVGLVKRAVEAGRKPTTLSAVSLQDAAAIWVTSDAMIEGLCPVGGSSDETIADYPALLPISWVCRQLRESKDATKLGKEVAAHTGIAVSHKHDPASWGAQVFREAILQRAITAAKGL